MERQRQPFNANPDTGRMAFRHEWEQPDERPCVVYPHPFWKDEAERLRYERAVKLAPPSQYPHMKLDEYLAEIVKLAEGIKPGPAVRAMPAGSVER